MSFVCPSCLRDEQAPESAQSLILLSACTPERIDVSQMVTLRIAADAKQLTMISCCDDRTGTGRVR